MDFLGLDPLLRTALQEDVGRGDITTDAILEGRSVQNAKRTAEARILAREEFILAGWPVFLRVFQLLGNVESEVYFREGERVAECIGTLRGETSVLLKGERVALNFLQRMSGISTLTRKFVDLIAPTGVRLLDTRKTTPLWRSLEKYAVRLGGGQNHRLGLDDGILIKENHVALAGGIPAAIEACRNRSRHLQKIEIEVRSIEELRQAVEAGAEVVLLDNIPVDEVRRAVQVTDGRCLLEVSGGVDESNIVQYAETGVDFVSLGKLTHSYRSVDISMLLELASR